MVTSGSRQAKGYAIQICVLLRSVPGVELGESKTFPIHRVLNEKTVHLYVVINDKLGGEEVVDAQKVKRTPAKKKGVTKKRPAAGDAEVAPIVKKKRTTKGKPVAAKRLPVEEPVGISTTSEQPVAEVATDAAIEQVHAQLDLVIKDLDVEKGDRVETWFDRAFDEEFETANQENQDSEDEIDFDVDNQELPVFDETRTVPEAGGSKSLGDDKAGEKAIGSTHSTEEHMSIDDLLMQISEDMITTAEITKIRLGESINIHEALKAKESLMLNWAETDSLEMAIRRRVYILAKYRELLLRKFLESHRKYLVPGQPWTATESKIIDLLSVAHSKSLEDLIAQQKEQQQPQVAQQSGHQRFRPCGQQFKKKSGSGSSDSGSSSSSGSRAEFCGFCGGKHPSTQCVGVQGSCNLCGQYGNFSRVCPSAGSQQTVAQPQGRGESADEEKQKMKRRRVEESADGLALMTSSVTSSYSADGLSLAVARISR
ncbi:hypothetical protein F511_39755 [Dorcoceras hygrometricum]|uniref:CCHC-type domain-containing protein n=1 Tax=Dorcoceras hygrometricum TaxID=472368 RepID=A0A2Z7CBM2_9LAMI|nr:hypothetical protein F511_39755 [Dorcoceras hygrometricum]